MARDQPTTVDEIVTEIIYEMDIPDEYETGFGYATPIGNPIAGGSTNIGNWGRAAASKVRQIDNDHFVNTGERLCIGRYGAMLIEQFMSYYCDKGGRPLDLTETYGTIELIVSRWVVGETGERAVEAADERTFVPVTEVFDSVDEAESAGADLVTESGTTLQVKTGARAPREAKIGDADELWYVPVKEDGHFGAPERVV